jgi:hypothetical protein
LNLKIYDLISEENMAKANTTETADTGSMNIRTFRNSADVENFYRFVNESGLRREAAIILDKVHKVIAVKKRGRKPKAKKIQ